MAHESGASMPVLIQAHIAGIPVEEMLLTVLPVTGVVCGWWLIRWKDRLRDRARGR